MEDLLKYQRVQGVVESIVKRGRITASAIETNYLVLGTDSGDIHVLSFSAQQVKHLKTHTHRVSAMSVCMGDDGALIVLSCSEDGRAVMTTLHNDNIRESVVNMDVSLTAVCLERDLLRRDRERSFVTGTAAGALLYRRPSWFAQKVVTLFAGDGTAVQSIAWAKELVAWADEKSVRVMNLETQTAICMLSYPSHLSSNDMFAFPCTLYWKNDQDLFVSWADSFRILTVGRAVADQEVTTNKKEITQREARTTTSWLSTGLICGAFPFDDEHVMLLTYVPPEDYQETKDLLEESMGSPVGSLAERVAHLNEPEVMIVKEKDGSVVSADVLPLKGLNLDKISGYSLLSSVQCSDGRSPRDARPFSAQKSATSRGGDKGRAPLYFIVSPQDVVCCRMRDADDKVRAALSQHELKRAVEIAKQESLSLREFAFPALLSIYLEQLLSVGREAEAANECSRLCMQDVLLWEHWLMRFVELSKTRYLAPFLPSTRPRLRNDLYEIILDSLMRSSAAADAKVYFECIKKWSRVAPPIFDHSAMLQRLVREQTRIKESDRLRAREGLDTRRDHDRERRAFLLEAQAQLYLVSLQHEQALNCYLDIELNDNVELPLALPGEVEILNSSRNDEYRHVFELIEKQNLFKLIENKIAHLVRLSRPLTAKLLLAHIDKLSIRAVASSLSIARDKERERDRKLLLWYLHLVFRDPNAHELYSLPEFADFHRRQAELYVEFATPTVPLPSNITSEGVASSSSSIQDKRRIFESPLIVFMRSGLAPLDVCLTECERRSPPLFPEIVIALSLLDKRRTALSVLLREIGDVTLAIKFIEDQLDRESTESTGFLINSQRRRGESLAATAAVASDDHREEANKSMHDALLWNDLISFCLDHPNALQELLDQLGVCSFEAHKVLSKILPYTTIPGLKPRLINILKELQYRREQDGFCKLVLQKDVRQLLGRKNHGQRRAIRVDCDLRCASCMRPLAAEAPLPAASLALSTTHTALPVPKESLIVWGQSSAHSSVLFSNKLAFHKACFDRIPQ